MHTLAPAAYPTPRLRLPLIGHEYGQVLRTPRSRWWNPLLSWAVAVLAGLLVVFVPMIAYGVFLAARGGGLVQATPDMADPSMVFMLNLVLACLIPVAFLAVLAGHPVRARFLTSVEGRMRWAWLTRCLLVLLPLWALYVIGAWLLGGGRNEGLSDGWVPLLAMVILMTPLQAAGEEYLFRGFVLASVGSWFRRPVVGALVGGIVSAALFAAAHGSADPWIVTDLVGMAVACVYLTWRTGGLEAAIAVHITNNVVVGLLGVLTGTTSEGYISADTKGSPEEALVSLAVSGAAVLLLEWQARRVQIRRRVPASVGARP